MQENNNLKNYFNLHLIVFIWGFTAVLGALISLDSIPLVWFRMLFATIFMFLFLVFKKKPIKISKLLLFKFVFGGILIAIHWITFFYAIKISNISIALITMSTGAFFTSILEPIFFKRKFRFLELFLGLFAISGLYIIFNVEGNYVNGIIVGLISSFLSASFSVLNGLYVKKNDPLIISFYQILFGVLFITILLLFKGGFNNDFFKLSISDWTFLIILSSICTAYAFSASIKVMRFLSPYTVMLTINLEPVYGIILALFIFPEKEKMPPNFYVGSIIILLSVVLNGILKNRKQLITQLRKK